MRLTILALAAMLLLSVPVAKAQAQETAGPYSAGSLREACRRVPQQNVTHDRQSAREEGVCVGVVATVLRLGPSMNDRLRFCPPPQTTLIDAMLILVKFLDDNPGSLKLNLRDVANSVFRQTWPCQ